MKSNKKIMSEIVELTKNLTEDAENAMCKSVMFKPSYINSLAVRLQQIALDLLETI